IKDRVQGTLSREFVFRKNFITTVSLYYEGRSGQGYSWVYSGDLNNDGVSGNDLIAVPSGADDARFDFSGMTAAQRDAYIAFIQSSGLAKYAGGYAPRNASLTPWQNRLDLNLRQEIPVASLFGTHVRLEAFLDFLNFGSWLDKHLFNYVEELNTGTTFGGLTRVLGNASYTAAGLIKPTATFASDGSISLPASSLIVVNNTDTRWRIQGGVSLKF
ncbi:MAG TPA: hypothetical protein VG710_14660, partial [Opitutus sp.]|nr:hypothetical protein [Opitutus sp.]